MHSELDANIAVEKFDDISFEVDGVPEELIQVKHHLGALSDLGDTSSDMWKTLRAWSNAIANNIARADTIFTILTTATCAEGSAAMYLKDGDGRNIDKAHNLLLAAAAKMKGETLKAAREEFVALGAAKRQALLNAAHVIDGTPTITDVTDRIRRALGFPVSAGHMAAFVERLEGWWFGQVIERLAGRNTLAISAVSLGLAIDELRGSFNADSLPIDFRSAQPPSSASTEDRIFVRQLELIKLDPNNINHARVDYYRAFAQRSRWLRDDLLNLPQLETYDDILSEEWKRERDWIEREAKEKEADGEVVKRGVTLYRYLQNNCPPIRPNCVERYVGRGSYHLLADRKRVGWHRDYLKQLDVSDATASAKEGKK